MKKYLKNTNKGITLIALVITIIVLLILAGVTIAMLMGDNGILTKATEAKNDQADATVKEAIALLWNEYQLEIKSSSNEEVKESTKIASTEITTIQGEKANYLAITATSFWDFLLTDKEVIDADGIVNVQKLTGQTLDRGNGTDGATDVYKIEEEEDIYTLKYCGANSEETILWEVSAGSSEDAYPEATPEEIFITNETDEGVEIIGVKRDGEIMGSTEWYRIQGGITNLVIPRTINGKNVIAIRNETFDWCNLESITVPENIKIIDAQAFDNDRYSRIKQIIFPNGVNENLTIPDNKWGATYAQIIGKDGEILKE